MPVCVDADVELLSVVRFEPHPASSTITLAHDATRRRGRNTVPTELAITPSAVAPSSMRVLLVFASLDPILPSVSSIPRMLDALLLATQAAAPPRHWTIVFYGSANNSCEQTILHDIAEMKAGFVDGQGVELVLFIDRMKGFSSDSRALGDDFDDSRLYRITHDRAERLDGAPELPEITKTSTFDANTGDARTLRQVMRFAKAHYPAERYALVFYSHGDGRAMCADDDSDGDELFPAEITDVLEERDSVDLMGFDVCSMGGVENLYQWRPGNGSFHADAVVASASVSGPWPYDTILARLRAPSVEGAQATVRGEPSNGSSSPPAAIDPAQLTAFAFAELIVEEKHRELLAMSPRGQAESSFESWAAYDLAHVADLKRAIDALAAELGRGDFKERVEALRGSGDGPLAMNYMMPGEPGWNRMPYFDVYDLARRIARDPELPEAVRSLAGSVASATDAVVGRSFGLAHYPGFESGRHGLFLVFPDGDVRDRFFGLAGRAWNRFAWYAPGDAVGERGRAARHAYGKYRFCADGAAPANGAIENWFELLDRWFDDPDDGGANRYRD